jgi:hypothetical protein
MGAAAGARCRSPASATVVPADPGGPAGPHDAPAAVLPAKPTGKGEATHLKEAVFLVEC